MTARTPRGAAASPRKQPAETDDTSGRPPVAALLAADLHAKAQNDVLQQTADAPTGAYTVKRRPVLVQVRSSADAVSCVRPHGSCTRTAACSMFYMHVRACLMQRHVSSVCVQGWGSAAQLRRVLSPVPCACRTSHASMWRATRPLWKSPRSMPASSHWMHTCQQPNCGCSSSTEPQVSAQHSQTIHTHTRFPCSTTRVAGLMWQTYGRALHRACVVNVAF